MDYFNCGRFPQGIVGSGVFFWVRERAIYLENRRLKLGGGLAFDRSSD
jgi:hypothetical protein